MKLFRLQSVMENNYFKFTLFLLKEGLVASQHGDIRRHFFPKTVKLAFVNIKFKG